MLIDSAHHESHHEWDSSTTELKRAAQQRNIQTTMKLSEISSLRRESAVRDDTAPAKRAHTTGHLLGEDDP